MPRLNYSTAETNEILASVETFDDTPTAGSTNPVESGGIWTFVNTLITALSNAISTITAVIPSQASSNNQLADKSYVDNGLTAKQNALTFDNAPTANSDNPVKSGGVKSYVDTGLAAKQNALTFDDAPTSGSSNPVKSGGVKEYVDGHYVTAGLDPLGTPGTKVTGEGYQTNAYGDYSHAEGYQTSAAGTASHSEGNNTIASGDYSHAEGQDTEATAPNAHAEGFQTTAEGSQSHAEGVGTYAVGTAQHVFGRYNAKDTVDSLGKNNYAEIVGNGRGSSSSNRSNARTLDWSGNEALAGSITLGKGTSDEVSLSASQLRQLLALITNN